ncbi:hypothetical protein [Spiroplasma taiwanense]|uniref:hypothetical protein n=1 Tax=Spiroplasma taiwanense TaxID=2145 RepID=UPI000425E22C|nr:hypothetical protein [Spiroplasma taiwanense]
MIQTSLGDNWSLSPEVSKETFNKAIKLFLYKIGLYNTEIVHYKNISKSTEEERKQFLQNFKDRFSK